MMTPAQISLVQQSFTRLLPTAETAAALFYERLFTLDAALRPLFQGDMHAQGQKLMSMLRFIVSGLGRPEIILPAVQSLGIRHTSYQVEPAHYRTVGSALLWMLEHELHADFTAEVRAAWAEAYTLLAETMIAAAAKAQG
jgi:hemoglobin-like flavoprotein